MMGDILHYKTDITAGSGKLLISEPMLQDQSFQKSVVFMCHHDENESLGYIINKRADLDLSHFIPELKHIAFPLHIGGPVALDSLHLLHTVPDLIGGDLIDHHIYWGGDLELAIENILLGKINSRNCKFLIGYSGWSEGQLDAELDMDAWLVSNASVSLVFETEESLLWKKSIAGLGQKFNPLLHVPMNPELN